MIFIKYVLFYISKNFLYYQTNCHGFSSVSFWSCAIITKKKKTNQILFTNFNLLFQLLQIPKIKKKTMFLLPLEQFSH